MLCGIHRLAHSLALNGTVEYAGGYAWSGEPGKIAVGDHTSNQQLAAFVKELSHILMGMCYYSLRLFGMVQVILDFFREVGIVVPDLYVVVSAFQAPFHEP